MRKNLIIFIVVLIVAAAAALIVIRRHKIVLSTDPLPAHQTREQSPASAPPKESPKPGQPETKSGLPESVLLPVPFTPQAPTANWDELHNEACEEASSLMAHAYFDGIRTPTLTPEYAEGEISRLTKWEQDKFGYHLDTTMEETARMVREVYGLKTELISNFTDSQLRDALAAGKLVIISEQGQYLHNPNYKQPGPLHHMLILRGYTSNEFITNDSGTRRGQNYGYSFKTIYEAAGDWDHGTKNVDRSKKIAMIVSK